MLCFISKLEMEVRKIPSSKYVIMQIDAHSGGVNDIAFAHPNKQLCVVTCGDDKLIKVSNEYANFIFLF